MQDGNESALIEYYGKFNEEKRLNSRHGRIEYEITMDYIRRILEASSEPGKVTDIADIGAGTGRYSVALAQEYPDISVTAVELVRHNLGRIRAKKDALQLDNLSCHQGNAVNLKKIRDDSADLTLLFGPMYHLLTEEEKLAAMLEAKRITRNGGSIMAAYCMNEYAFLIHAIREGNIMSDMREGKLDESWHVRSCGSELYSFMRLEDIDRLNQKAGLVRERIFSPDGPANHMRQEINRLTDEEYACFVNYQKSVCERPDLIGAGAHTVDVLRVKK